MEGRRTLGKNNEEKREKGMIVPQFDGSLIFFGKTILLT